MTREEAIKWMEETIQDAEEFFDKCSPELREEVLKQNEVFKIAISALRSAPQPGKPLTLEQLRERWERCEHCRGNNELRYPSAHELVIDGRDIYYHDTDDGWEGVEINFCPWCGRPLTDEAWAELERRVMG